MRYRQIHLDFHTSERIPDIGSRFDPDDFGRTFAKANVDSVTIFCKMPSRGLVSSDQGRQAASAPRLRSDARAARCAPQAWHQRADLHLRRLGRACGARESGLARRHAGRRADPPARRAARAGLGVPRLQLALSRLPLPAGRRGASISSRTATASSSTSASRW